MAANGMEGVVSGVQDTATIKIQKKRSPSTIRVPISQVQTWERLLAVVKTYFPPPAEETPELVTFDGVLLQRTEDYTRVLTRNLHILVSYPSDLNELAFAFSNLLGRHDTHATAWSITSHRWDNRPPCTTPAPTRSPVLQPRFHLLPPKLSFYPLRETHFHVTMDNSSVPDVCNFSRWRIQMPSGIPDEAQKRGGTPAIVVDGLLVSEGVKGDMEHGSEKGVGVLATGSDALPPWSPYIYTKPGEAVPLGKSSEAAQTQCPSVVGRTLPTSVWEVWAQDKGKKVTCSVSVEFTASPADPDPALLTDVVSKEQKRTLDWALSPEPEMERDRKKSSETRMYASYDQNYDTTIEQRERQGWWMANTAMLPTRFSGNQGERTFLCRGIVQAQFFLNGVLTACGVGVKETKDFVQYWIRNLMPASSGFKAPVPAEEYLIIVKFLTQEELRRILPLNINPVPDRLVRIFPLFRTLTREELVREKIACRGIFPKEVDLILGGRGICGGGPGCGHGGCLRVFELGGARVFGPVEENEARDTPPSKSREQTPGLLVGDEGMVAWRG